MSSDGRFLDYDSIAPAARLRPPVAADDGAAWGAAPADEGDSDVRPSRRAGEGVGRFSRGHAFSYAGLFLFTVVLYFRPYEYVPGLKSFTSMAFVVALLTLAVFFPAQLALEGNLTARPREIKLVLLLVVTAILSVPLAASPGEAWAAFLDPFGKAVLMFVVMVNAVRSLGRLKGLLLLALAIGCVLSVGAVVDFRQGNLTVEGYRVAGVIGGLFGNPNEMALNLVVTIPVAVALLLSSRKILGKAFYGGAALLMVGGVLVTFSRGGFLGLACAAGLLAWRLRRRKPLGVALCGAAALCLLLVLVPAGYGSRIASIFDHSLDAVGSASQRQNLLFLSVKVALANPLLGIGIGCFPIVSIRGLVTHNAYTQVAAEMGLLAGALFVMFLVTPFRGLRRLEREAGAGQGAREARFYYLSVGLQASIIGYMVGAFFISSAYMWYTYYLVGYAVCLRRIREAETNAADETGLTPAARREIPDSTEGFAGEER